MRIGLQVPNFTYPEGPEQIASTLANIAQTADQSGFYSLWVMDHFFQIQGYGLAEQEMLEGYSTLSYFAALTKNVKLGTLVTGVIYRHPGLLVKTATTLDVLSGGRAYLGIGAAWYEREAKGLGVPYPETKVRFEMLEEALQIAHQMWGDEVKPYAGKHYQLAEAMNRPQPVSKPHPPILIGGMGEKKTLRLVAQYANACNFFARAGIPVLVEKLDTLKKHCDEVGRDYNAIEKTVIGTLNLKDTSVSDAIALLKELAGLGIHHVIFNMPNTHEIKPIETIASEIIPAVHDL